MMRLLILWGGLVGVTLTAWADCLHPLGQIVALEGRAMQLRGTQQNELQTNTPLCSGDRIQVSETGRVALRIFGDNSMVRLGPRSLFTLPTETTGHKFSLLDGILNLFTRTPQQLRINTPFLNAAVDGTEFAVAVGPQQTQLWVTEGRVTVTQGSQQQRLNVGESAVGRADGVTVLQVSSREAVQWAIHYPPTFDFEAATFQTPALQAALTAYRQNDFVATLAALEAQQTVAARQLRATVWLRGGRIAEAENELRGLPQDGGAWAMRAVIALVQGNNPQPLLEQALALAPDDLAVRVAQSYVAQAQGAIATAVEQMTQAVRRDPQSGLAWARLSELQLMNGQRRAAVESANKAVQLAPDLARSHLAQGFVRLARLELHEAEQAFRAALTQDSGEPLAFLGLGLLEIRRGRLVQGREHLETATALDPQQSLLRSYLGKAYFDERRYGLAREQYALAKEQDDDDPTPWFYQSLLELLENQPVTALKMAQEAQRRNNRRGVYRSRLLLDQDSAARAAQIGRIYEELGFSELMLMQGLDALSDDPRSDIAHRLLSDAYAHRDRHAVARASELLKSQLFQPLRLNLLPPQTIATDLGILRNAGPSQAGYNEYNALFHRQGWAAQLNGVVGNRGTWGNDLVIGALYDHFAFSVGQFHYETDGLHPNGQRQRDIGNLLMQWQPFEAFSGLFEYRYSRRTAGDIVQNRLYAEDPVVPDDVRERRNVWRLAGRFDWSPRLTTLLNFSYNTEDFRERYVATEQGVPYAQADFEEDEKGYTFEAQQLFQWDDRQHFTLGAKYTAQDIAQIEQLTFFGGQWPPTLNDERLRVGSVYGYYQGRVVEPLQITVGVGVDHLLQRLGTDKTLVHPKLGMRWQATDSGTLRLAAFRSLQRPITGDQTLEITQIAGFNQIYDVRNIRIGAEVWRYGVGWDQQWSPSVSGGVELSRFAIRSPDVVTENAGLSIQENRVRETLGRAYLYWAVNSQFTLAADYLFNDLRSNDFRDSGGRFYDLQTHRAQLTGRYFMGNGWSGFVTQHGVHQQGHWRAAPIESLVRNNPDQVHSRRTRFGLTDIGVNYRFPKGQGALNFEVRNLFDRQFGYEDYEQLAPTFLRERTLLMRFSLNF